MIKEPPPQNSIVLMDVPGYGHNSQTAWGEEILKYLEHREMLRGAVLLVDAVVGVKQADRMIMRALRDIGVCTSVVLTKADALVRKPDYEAWATSKPLQEATLHVLEEMRNIEKRGDPQTQWSEGIEWNPEIFVTGAGDPRMGGMGVDGARLAISRMAGHIKTIEAPAAATEDEGSEIVPYDQLVFSPITTATTMTSVAQPGPGVYKPDQLVFDLEPPQPPPKTRGRVRLGRRRQAGPLHADDPMAALLGASNVPSRKKLGEASF